MNSNGTTTLSRDIIADGLWRNNPIFRQILGICSTLAVTNVVLNTMVMCVSLTIVTAFSCFTISLLRKWTPMTIRMMVQTLVIAFYVIIVDVTLKAYWPAMSTNLSPYVGLIITNCIVLGRAEGFAMHHGFFESVLDGLGNGLGYSLILIVVATIREFFGKGSLLNIQILIPTSQVGAFELLQ